MFILCEYHDLLIRHLLDVMHSEKNLSVNLMKTIFGQKNTAKVRQDMEVKGEWPHIWLQRHSHNARLSVKPHATCVLTLWRKLDRMIE